MQDNFYKPDRKFTNHAWGEMEKLLDREMPTGRRKRRLAGWWWLLGAGLIGAGIGAGWLFSPKKQLQRLETKVPVAVATPSLQSNLQEQIVSAESISQKQHLAKSANPSTVNSKTASRLNTSRHAAANGFFSRNQPIDNQSLAIKNPNLVKTENETNHPHTPADFFVENASLYNPTVSLQTPELDLLPELAMSAPNLAAAKLQVPVRPVNWLAYGSGAYSPISRGSSLAGGVLAEVQPLPEKRLTLETGAGYAIMQQPLDVLLVAAEVGGGNAPPSTDQSESNLSAAYNSYDTFKRSAEQNNDKDFSISSYRLTLHYLEIPVLAKWKAGKRWQVIGGLNAGALLASDPGFTNGGYLQPSKDVFMADNEPDQHSQGFSIPLAKLDLAAVAGVRCFMTPRLGFDLRLQNGFTDVIRKNDHRDLNQLARLSVLYRLGGK